MPLESELSKTNSVIINQRKELVELIGFETRNKYSIETLEGLQIGYAAEQQKGFIGMFLRQILGHWRHFEILIFGTERQQEYRAVHPFRWFFQRLELHSTAGEYIGALQGRFSILRKKFDLEDRYGNIVLEVASPLWRLWTFNFTRGGNQKAMITKKWGGLLKEGFTDTDRFLVEFKAADLSREEKLLLIAAGIFIDLQYFENNQRSGSRNILDLLPSR